MILIRLEARLFSVGSRNDGLVARRRGRLWTGFSFADPHQRVTVSAVPEPTSAVLVGLAFAAVGMLRRNSVRTS